jgi:hypothetical protein
VDTHAGSTINLYVAPQRLQTQRLVNAVSIQIHHIFSSSPNFLGIEVSRTPADNVDQLQNGLALPPLVHQAVGMRHVRAATPILSQTAYMVQEANPCVFQVR